MSVLRFPSPPANTGVLEFEKALITIHVKFLDNSVTDYFLDSHQRVVGNRLPTLEFEKALSITSHVKFSG